MTRNELILQIKEKKTFLCVGLDSEIGKLPSSLEKTSQGILSFNQKIIQATAPHCIAYKPNLAFYEALGYEGLHVLKQTMDSIPASHFKIADAKRGDIGNTSTLYAKAFFEQLNFDAITVNPYMGIDSVKPFLEYPDKWVILLGLTSNIGSSDFQLTKNKAGKYLFEQVIETSSKWGTSDQMMFVIGATHPEFFKSIRKIIPDHFLLVPGIGAQGGQLETVFEAGANQDIGLIINSSRAIIYASQSIDYAEKAAEAAAVLSHEMKHLIPDL
jgi:orotidine-5'-phosphate decarboxylase